MSSQPRGIRNNNPLNIRIGNDWAGEVSEPTDPQFEQFVSMLYGLRAGFKLLRRYIEHYRRNTIRRIITSWAPASENDTEAYIKFVSYHAGIDPDLVLSFSDKKSMCLLVSAMCRMECGVSLASSLIEEAYIITAS